MNQRILAFRLKRKIQKQRSKQEQDGLNFMKQSPNEESDSKKLNNFSQQNTNAWGGSTKLNQSSYSFNHHNDITVLLTPGYIEIASSKDIYEEIGRVIAQNPVAANLKHFESVIDQKQSPIQKYLWQTQSKIKSIIENFKNSLIVQSGQEDQKKENNKKYIQEQLVFPLEKQTQIKNDKKRRLRRGSVRLQINNDQWNIRENKDAKDGLEQFRILSTPTKSFNDKSKIVRDLNISIWHAQGLKIGQMVMKFAMKKKDVVIVAHYNLTNLVQLCQIDLKIKDLLIKYGATTEEDLSRQAYRFNSSQSVRLKSLGSKNRLEYWTKHIRKNNPKCIIGHLYILQSQKNEPIKTKIANESNIVKLVNKSSKNLCFLNFKQSDQQFENPEVIPKEQQQKISIFPIQQCENEYIIILQVKTKKKSSFLQVEANEANDEQTKKNNKQRLQKIIDDLLSQYFKVNNNVQNTNSIKKKLDFDKTSIDANNSYPSYSMYKKHRSETLKKDTLSHQRNAYRRKQSLNMKFSFQDDDDDIDYYQIHKNISEEHKNRGKQVNKQKCQNLNQIKKIESKNQKTVPMPCQINLQLSSHRMKQSQIKQVQPKKHTQIEQPQKQLPKRIIKSAQKQKRSSSVLNFLSLFCCKSNKNPQIDPNSMKVIDKTPRVQKKRRYSISRQLYELDNNID